MRTLQGILHFRRSGAIGLAIVLLLVTLAGLVYAIPSKAAKRPNAHGPRPAATPAFIQRPPSSATDWPMYRGNPTHVGVNTAEALLNPVTARGLGLSWREDIGPMCGGGHTGWSPTVVGGIVYIETYGGSYSGALCAVNELTGRLLWSFTVTGFMEAAPAVVNGVVYATNYPGTLYALNATTGQQIWSYNYVSAGVEASPTVVNGVVYVGSTAVNATTGKRLWDFVDTNSGGFESSAAVVNGVVYLVSQNGYLYALDAANGTLLWKYTGSGGRNVYASPVVANGIVYYGWFNLYAVDATTGKLVWQNTHGGSQPAVSNGIVYIGDNAIYAFDAATGAVVWSVDPGAYDGFGSPVVANGVVYVSSAYSNAGYPGDTLYALDASSGATLWQYTGDDVFTPVVANDRVVARTGSSTFLYAFQPAIQPLTATH